MAVVALVGIALGFFLRSSDGVEVQRLQAELAELKSREAMSPATLLRPPRRPSAFLPPHSADSAEARDRTNIQVDVAARKAQAKTGFINSVVTKQAQKTSEEYTRVFSDLGVPPERIGPLKELIASAHAAEMNANLAIQELHENRDEFDKQVRSAMSEESYSQYRAFEDRQPAIREFDMLEKYVAVQDGVAIDPELKETIISLMEQSKAYTARSSRRPYEEFVPPVHGNEKIIEHLEGEIKDHVERSAQLLLAAEADGVPDDLQKLISSYYGSRIERLHSVIESARNLARNPEILSDQKARYLEMLERERAGHKTRQRR